jgi:competence protein ComEC
MLRVSLVVLLLVSFLVGVAVAQNIWSLLFLVCLLFVRRVNIVMLLIVVCAGGVGFIRALTVPDVQTPEYAHLVGQTVMLSGTIIDDNDLRETSRKYVVEGSIQNGPQKKFLITTDRTVQIKRNDYVTVSGTMQQPEPFLTDTGRYFDYDTYLAVEGIGYLMYYPEIIDHQPATFYANTIFSSVRNSFIRNLQMVIPEPEASLGAGILLGAKRSLGEDVTEQFRRSGLIHIVVLSGYNVALVVFALIVLLKRFSNRIRTVASLLGIATFVLLVGADPPVLRAGLMASVIIFAESTGNKSGAFSALLLATAIIVFISPLSLFGSLSLQLSVVATLGILYLSPIIERWLSFLPQRFSFREIMAATIGTQVAVLPLLATQIGEVSLIAPVANALVLPIVPFAMFITFIAGVVAYVSITFAMPFAFIASFVLSLMLWIAEFFGTMQLAVLGVPYSISLGLACIVSIVSLYLVIREQNVQPLRQK